MKTHARHKVQCIKEAKITIPKCFNLELVKHLNLNYLLI
jgi:hypothetical protein